MKLKTKKKLVVDTDCLEAAIVEALSIGGPMTHDALWRVLFDWGKGSDISYFRVALNGLQIDGKIDRTESGEDDGRFVWSIAN